MTDPQSRLARLEERITTLRRDVDDTRRSVGGLRDDVRQINATLVGRDDRERGPDEAAESNVRIPVPLAVAIVGACATVLAAVVTAVAVVLTQT